MADPYDLLRYTEHAYAESAPDNLYAVARLSGFHVAASPAVHAARILELGSGRGGNLLPLASHWPTATFVGVDRSRTQVRDARRVAEAAVLPNIHFHEADFARFVLPKEPFDYVLCHGVYSWIPQEDRRVLLQRITDALAPEGIAYVSFNTLPGWYQNQAARDWLRFAARSSFEEGPTASLEWLRSVASPETFGYRDDLARVHRRLTETDASYLTHEYLADEHHPVHVATFLTEANAAGLTYLGDALPRETAIELLPDTVLTRAKAKKLDLSALLTLADFTRNTAFRRALLVRSDTARTRGFTAKAELDPQALGGLRVSSRLVAKGGVAGTDLQAFTDGTATVHASGLGRRILSALEAAAPRSVPCDALADALGAPREAVFTELYDHWLASSGLDLHAREPDFTTSPSHQPRADPVARWHVLEGGPVTNAWHHEVELEDDVLRFVLARLDGQTPVPAITQAVHAHGAGRVTLEEARAVTVASLEVLAKAGLLVG